MTFLLLYNVEVVTFGLAPHRPLHKKVFTWVTFLYLHDIKL